MPIERETKLLVGPDFKLPDLQELVEGVILASDEVVEQKAVYFDTTDLRLTHSGVSLRYRSDDGWTVKLPEAGTTSSSLVRAEHSFLGGPESPPEAAVDLVRAWIRTAPLGAVASVTTQRHRFTLTDSAGKRLAEIADDRVETSARDGAAGDFREIEIELDERAPDRLGKRLTKQLRHAGETKRSRISKVARAVGLRDATPRGSETDTTAKNVTTRDFVQAVLEDSLRRLIAHDPVIRIGEDTEGVHQARVATRKLRSHLHTFAPILTDKWGEPLRDELSWLADLLGHARDADVLADLLRSTTNGVPAGDRGSTADLFDQLTAQGLRARADLLQAMSSARYATLLDTLVEAACHPQLRADVELKPARDVVTPLAFHQWKRLRRAVRRLDAEPADADLHKVRRRAKQARYALEAAGPLTGDASLKLAKRAEQLQGVLGDHQDRVVAGEWLSDAAQDQPRNAFVAGELTGLMRTEQRALRADAKRLLRRTRKTRVRGVGM